MSFDVFDWPYAIIRVDVIPGYADASGDWIAEQTSETAITGHVTDLTQEERQYVDPGILLKGTRKLSTSSELAAGDRIKITEADSSETEWIVDSKMHENELIGKYVGTTRTTYLLVLKA